MPGRWEALAAENPVMFVDDGGDMEILVCIDAAHDEAVGDALLDLHGRTPEECIGASANTECLDRTVTRQNVRPYSGHMHRQGEPRRQVFSGGRRIRGKTPDGGRSECGSGRTEAPCGTTIPNKRSIAVRVRPPRNSWPVHALSEWWIRPLGGRQFRMAIFSASSHRVLLRRSDIDHPTISIVARSFTAAR